MAAVHLPPLRQTGVAAVRLLHQQPEAVLVITPALVYGMKGDVYVLSTDIVQAVDDFKVPDGYRTEGCREPSFMYSLGVYVASLAEEDHKPKYFCMADPSCR